MERLPVVDRPRFELIGPARVRIDTDDHLRPFGVAIGPGGVAVPDPARGAVDRIQMHRRVHRRQPRAVFDVALDGLVADLVDEIGAPVPLVSGRIELVERGLEGRERHRLDAV